MLAGNLENDLLRRYAPNIKTETTRAEVMRIIRLNIQKILPHALVAEFGSYPFKTYLPDGDIDVTLVVSPVPLEEFMEVEVIRAIMNQFQFASTIRPDYRIQNLTEINAEVKLLKGEIYGVPFDITINQIGGLCSLHFLEQVNQQFSNYFYKRCAILVKAWATRESRITGSVFGLLSSYALEILILYILNCYPLPATPLDVLQHLIEKFADFDWEGTVITCCGLIPADQFYDKVKKGKRKPEEACGSVQNIITPNFVKSIYEDCVFYKNFNRTQNLNKKAMNLKFINIADPLIPCNNLGKSVNKSNYLRIQAAFRHARDVINTQGIAAIYASPDDYQIQPRICVEKCVPYTMRWGPGESTRASSLQSSSPGSPRASESFDFNLDSLNTSSQMYKHILQGVMTETMPSKLNEETNGGNSWSAAKRNLAPRHRVLHR